MRFKLLLLWAFLITVPLPGNIAGFSEGKGGIIIPVKNRLIGMESENITILVNKLAWEIYELVYTCDFTFKNNSQAVQNVLMGFPFLQFNPFPGRYYGLPVNRCCVRRQPETECCRDRADKNAPCYLLALIETYMDDCAFIDKKSAIYTEITIRNIELKKETAKQNRENLDTYYFSVFKATVDDAGFSAGSLLEIDRYITAYFSEESWFKAVISGLMDEIRSSRNTETNKKKAAGYPGLFYPHYQQESKRRGLFYGI